MHKDRLLDWYNSLIRPLKYVEKQVFVIIVKLALTRTGLEIGWKRCNSFVTEGYSLASIIIKCLKELLCLISIEDSIYRAEYDTFA